MLTRVCNSTLDACHCVECRSYANWCLEQTRHELPMQLLDFRIDNRKLNDASAGGVDRLHAGRSSPKRCVLTHDRDEAVVPWESVSNPARPTYRHTNS